jgi:DNA modification methylase
LRLLFQNNILLVIYNNQWNKDNSMLQIKLPFDPPKSGMKHLSYRDRLLRLLEGDLDFHGQKNTTAIHTWHAFPAKFPPQLPRVFITELTQPGDIVFDPMMGSCTTLVEAVTLERRAVGTDIDPLSIRLGLAKLSAGDVTNVLVSGRELAKKAKQNLSNHVKSLKKHLNNKFDSKTEAFVNYWFAPATQLELIALISEIENIKDKKLRTFFTLIFSAIIITKSGGVSLARDLAHTRPHRVTDKIPKSAIEEFTKRLHRNLNNLTCQTQTAFLILEANSQDLPLADHSIDLIITSPPYASNAIDYMRAHKFSLVWLGHSVTTLSKIRRTYIGGETITGFDMLSLPEYTRRIVDNLAAVDQKKGKVLHRYYSEMSRTLSEMHRVLRPGCAAVIVVGTSLIRGLNIEIQSCLKEIGEQNGLEHIHTGIRRLDRDKRMMPARWNKKQNTGIEARMHEEYIIGFQKPER